MTDAEVFALAPHPLALKLPRDDEGLPALAASVGIEGVREEVVIMNGQILDGLRRREAYRLAVAQGVRPPGGFRWRHFNPKTDGDPWDFVLCRAVQHRAPPKGEAAYPMLREELSRNHQKSDKAVAARTGLHYTTVRDMRRRMEEEGLIPAHDRLQDANGVMRPAGRRKKDDAPPDAGDAWEPAPEGSEEAARDREVVEAGKKVFDDVGVEVPAHLRDAMADGFYEDCWTSLAYMAKHIGANPKLYVRLHMRPEKDTAYQRLKRLAEEMRAVLEYHRPRRVCPECAGREGGCENCFGTGWLSAGQCQEQDSYRE